MFLKQKQSFVPHRAAKCREKLCLEFFGLQCLQPPQSVVLLQKRRPDETDNTVPGYSFGFVYVQVVIALFNLT
jgi:hypothetical protein